MEWIDRRVGVRESRHDISSSHYQSGTSGVHRVQQTIQVPRNNDIGEKGKRSIPNRSFRRIDYFITLTHDHMYIVYLAIAVFDARVVFTTLQSHALGAGHGLGPRGGTRVVSARQIFTVRQIQIDQRRRDRGRRSKPVERHVVCVGRVVEQRYRRGHA